MSPKIKRLQVLVHKENRKQSLLDTISPVYDNALKKQMKLAFVIQPSGVYKNANKSHSLANNISASASHIDGR